MLKGILKPRTPLDRFLEQDKTAEINISYSTSDGVVLEILGDDGELWGLLAAIEGGSIAECLIKANLWVLKHR